MSGNGTFWPFGGHTLAVPREREICLACFADEVAIDFPSIAGAVERMRRGLLHDERVPPQPAELALPRHAAAAGATVPLDVTVRCICHGCGGRGESWAEPCLACGGTGAEILSHQVQVSVPAGVVDGACFYFTVTPRHHPATRVELRISVV